jgi:hypothetical protein
MVLISLFLLALFVAGSWAIMNWMILQLGSAQTEIKMMFWHAYSF